MKKKWTIIDSQSKGSNQQKLVDTKNLLKLQVPSSNKYILINKQMLETSKNNLNYGILNLDTKNLSLKSQSLNKTNTPILNLIVKKDNKSLKNKSEVIKTPLSASLLLQSNAKYSNKYKGLQIRLAGRIRGAQRAKNLQVNHGRISSQTFNSSLLFNKKQFYTKWGTWGSSIYIARSS